MIKPVTTNNTIWKFGFSPSNEISITMPKGAEILTLQTVGNNPFIWAFVNSEAENEKRHFKMYGTGHIIQIKENTMERYIGTYQLYEGTLVFHLWEVIEI